MLSIVISVPWHDLHSIATISTSMHIIFSQFHIIAIEILYSRNEKRLFRVKACGSRETMALNIKSSIFIGYWFRYW